MAGMAWADRSLSSSQYLAHPDNHKVNFTLLLQPGYWFHGQEAGSNETWAQARLSRSPLEEYAAPIVSAQRI